MALPAWFVKVQAEAKKYGVPDWIWQPLATAESSDNPAASGGGLFQIQPGYPGYHGQNLADPVQNADLAFAQLSKSYKKQGSPKQSVTAYENVIGTSGFDTFQGWANEGAGTGQSAQIKQNYINAYNYYSDNGKNDNGASTGTEPKIFQDPGSIVPDVTGAITGLPGAIGDKVHASLPYVLLAVGLLLSFYFLLSNLTDKQGSSVPVGHFQGAPAVAAA